MEALKNYRPFKSFQEFSDFMRDCPDVEFDFKDPKVLKYMQDGGYFDSEVKDDYSSGLLMHDGHGGTYTSQWLFENVQLTYKGVTSPFGVERLQ